MESFVYSSNPGRIIFGPGSLLNVADEIRRLGCKRALVLSTPFQSGDAKQLSSELGELSAGVFTDATMHTPVEVTEKALEVYSALGADCVVSLGGGSTIGLGKAIAFRNDAPQVVVPTTYAGSEVTPVLGQTEKGIKTTMKDSSILPEVVIYDANLSLGLPVSMSVTSGLNAMAHAIEGLYAQDRNPITALMAVEGVRALKKALPVIIKQPTDVGARSEALYGAWLCGTVLGTVGMSLHHKLCHTLGGSFSLPHAETHAVMLPHTAAFNSTAAADQLKPVAELFGGQLGAGIYDFAKSLGAPQSLRELGMSEFDLDRASDLAVKNPYWSPRPVEKDSVRALLQRAWEGACPERQG